MPSRTIEEHPQQGNLHTLAFAVVQRNRVVVNPGNVFTIAKPRLEALENVLEVRMWENYILVEFTAGYRDTTRSQAMSILTAVMTLASNE